MRTTHSSSHLLGGCLPQYMLGSPLLGVGLETPHMWAWRPPPICGTPLGVGLDTPWVWAWRPPHVGLETPQARPLNSPLIVGLETPPRPDPSTSPLGVGLETCKACWDTPWRPARHAGIPPAMHAGIPHTPPYEQNDRGVQKYYLAPNFVYGR